MDEHIHTHLKLLEARQEVLMSQLLRVERLVLILVRRSRRDHEAVSITGPVGPATEIPKPH